MLVHGAREVVAKQRADDAGERRGRCRPEAKVGALEVSAQSKAMESAFWPAPRSGSRAIHGLGPSGAQAAHALLLLAQRAAMRKREAPRAVGIRLYRLPGARTTRLTMLPRGQPQVTTSRAHWAPAVTLPCATSLARLCTLRQPCASRKTVAAAPFWSPTSARTHECLHGRTAPKTSQCLF